MKKHLFLILLTSFAFNVYSQPTTLQKIKDSGIVNIGVRTNADPFSSYQDGLAKGYIVDLCNLIVEDIEKSVGKKLNIQYSPVTPSNRFELVDSGKIDLECGTTTVNNERRSKADFSYNTFITSTNFITLSENKSSSPREIYNKLVETGKKIAIMKGTSHEDMVFKITLGKSDLVTYVNSIEEGLTTVYAGKSLAFVQDKVLLEKGIQNLKLSKTKFAFSQESLSIEPYSIMVKKNDSEMLNLVNHSLRQIYKTGKARNLMTEWIQNKFIDINPLTLYNLKNPSTENAVN